MFPPHLKVTMALTPQTLRFILFFIISLTMQHVAGRNVPTDTSVLQPEWIKYFDRSVLIPGMGRVMVPKKGSHVKLFHYNPVTGAPSGHSVSIPGVGSSNGGASGHSYIPGGDDTYLPNPGVEVPNPVGRGVSVPSGP
ncbi:hypothetical protein OROHE_012540 [Orobanche hederae]